jgi:spermidine/putrescine transport system permease protein
MSSPSNSTPLVHDAPPPAIPGTRRVNRFFRHNGVTLGVALIAAVLIWTVFLIVVPQLFMLNLSLSAGRSGSVFGAPVHPLSLANFVRFFVDEDGAFNVVQIKSLMQTLAGSIAVTCCTFALAYPVAFMIAQRRSARGARLLLTALLLPYWLNEVLRAYAFAIIFSGSGFLNTLLGATGLVGAPVDFINSNVALYTALVYAYLLFMFFPLYAAVDGVGRDQMEAARDLGAPWWHIHLFIVLPGARAGVSAGCTLVFMLCAGSLVIPQVLGGTSSLWFTPVVYNRFFESYDWPQGAAYAVLLVLACVLVVALVRRFLGRASWKVAP